MTSLDALKAGIKSGIITFLGALLLAVTGWVNEVNDWLTKRDPVDWSVGTGIIFAAAAALGVAVLGAGLRFIQVKAIPVAATIVDKLLGAVPAYPEVGATKVIDPAPTPADEGMRPKDVGESSLALICIVIVAVLVALILYHSLTK